MLVSIERKTRISQLLTATRKMNNGPDLRKRCLVFLYIYWPRCYGAQSLVLPLLFTPVAAVSIDLPAPVCSSGLACSTIFHHVGEYFLGCVSSACRVRGVDAMVTIIRWWKFGPEFKVILQKAPWLVSEEKQSCPLYKGTVSVCRSFVNKVHPSAAGHPVLFPSYSRFQKLLFLRD